jgi:hypothetical protein
MLAEISVVARQTRHRASGEADEKRRMPHLTLNSGGSGVRA